MTTDAGARTHNKQNELTAIGTTILNFDNNGNTTTDETGKQFVFDAWNRLVQVKDATPQHNVLTSCKYDALGRRIVENPGTATDLYYSAAWQVLEERQGTATKVQYVWSPVYVDAMILRDRDSTGGGTLNERLWVQQDANYNVTALVGWNGTNWVVNERFVYDPYGQATLLNPDWSSTSPPDYAWRYLHQGGRFDTTSGLYYFRRRDYSPTLMRWMEVDPIGFAAGDSDLYRYLGNDPSASTDPTGLSAAPQLPEWMLRLVAYSPEAASPGILGPALAVGAGLGLSQSLYYPNMDARLAIEEHKAYQRMRNLKEIDDKVAEARSVGVPEYKIQRILGPTISVKGTNVIEELNGAIDYQVAANRRKKADLIDLKTVVDAIKALKAKYEKIKNTDDDPCKKENVRGPYSFLALIDRTPINKGAKFEREQKDMVRFANLVFNAGKLTTDDPANDRYRELVWPEVPRSPMPMNQAEVDHIVPMAKGGSNSLCNARVISNWLNEKKRCN